MKLWVLSFFIAATFALPTTDDNELTENDPLSCDDVFTNNGMNFSSFYKGAAHGIHSLSLEEIRHFFKEDAPEDNGIPTVNIDLQSNNIFHFHAPLWGYEDRFDTWALKIMDWFMLNDRTHLYESGVNTLEKITHQYHMQEIYQRAAVIYNDLLNNPPKDVNGICSCANDLTWNGIMKEVVTIARQLRHFGQNSRKGKARDFRGYTGCSDAFTQTYRDYRGYKGPCGKRKRSADDADEDIEELMRDYLSNSNQQTAEKVVDSSVSWKPGTFVGPDFGKEKWVPYAAMLTYSLPEGDGIRDFAYFIYCMLNHPAKQD